MIEEPFKNSSYAKFKGISKSQQVSQGQNAIDFLIPFDCIINAMQFINTVQGESAILQVLDTPNLIGYGANAIIDTFPHEPRFCKNEITYLKTNYGARLKQGWTVRIIYASISEKIVYVNLDLHQVRVSLGEFWVQE